jgi:hypothetical protein
LQASFIISALRVSVTMNSQGSEPNSRRSGSMARGESEPTMVNGGV